MSAACLQLYLSSRQRLVYSISVEIISLIYYSTGVIFFKPVSFISGNALYTVQYNGVCIPLDEEKFLHIYTPMYITHKCLKRGC